MFNDEDEEIGFVICASCGARIKANRERCLRCEAPLVAWKKPELLPTWLQRMGGGTLIFGIVAVIVLAAAVVMFMQSQTPDNVARPGSRTASAPGAAQISNSSNAGSSASAGAVEPLLFLDAPSRGTIDPRGDFASVRARYEEALEKRPADPELLNSLGLTLERVGQVDAALARFERATQVDPQNWAYHFNLAHAASLKTDWDVAIAEYRLAANLLPGDFATRYNLGMAMQRKGDSAGAIPEFQKGIEIAPSVGAFHLALAVSFEKLGRSGEAEREYQSYLQMSPSAPDADAVRLHVQAMTGRPRS